METLADFMDRYLKEKIACDRAQREARFIFSVGFYTQEYLDRIKRFMAAHDSNPPLVERIEETGDTGAVIVREWVGREQRLRYRLLRSGGEWRIHDSDFECFACEGKGSKGSSPCRICKGGGWLNHSKED